MSKRRAAAGVTAAVAAGALAAAAAAASPVTGSIFGKVTGVAGGTFSMTSQQVPGGKAVVTVGKATIIEQRTGTRADVRKGVCATALGTTKNGVVTAQRLTLTSPVKGGCTGGFGRRPGGGTRTGTLPRPPRDRATNGNGNGNGSGFRRPANFGFAAGAITAVSGSTFTVKGPPGTSKVTLAKATTISRTVTVAASAISTKACAFVNGTSTDKGKTVTAQRIALTPATASGCTGGFGRRPGG